MKKRITKAEFEIATGEKSSQDDLQRTNCKLAGQDEHKQCGWNYQRNLPVFMAGKEENG